MGERPGTTVRARVPATCANLGPGFDSFGLALQLYDEVEARVAGDGLRIDVVGEGADTLRRDESHLVARALRAGCEALSAPIPGLSLTCRNTIPQGRGLGSSAAAITAGLLLAREVAGVPTHDRDEVEGKLLTAGTRLEGHPDNVAACWYGGFTLAWQDGPGTGAVPLAVHPAVRPTLFLPPGSVSTVSARGLLPDTVVHHAAVANASRAGLLVVALTQRPDLLLIATEDRLHQEYRRPAMPESLRLVDTLRAAGIAAVISGAGPAVLALTAEGSWDAEVYCPHGWRIQQLPVADEGAGAMAGQVGAE